MGERGEREGGGRWGGESERRERRRRERLEKVFFFCQPCEKEKEKTSFAPLPLS